MHNGNGPRHDGQLVRIPKVVLEDRILGAWVGKSYGAAMGEPLEFAFNGRMFLGAVDVQEHALREWLVNEDDLYMNMAMLAVVADKGLTASSEDFAAPYREAKFLVWHANGQARQNVLAGIPAELAGHPAYNPHADDIDFQIECDYIGMISPGLPEAAQDLCRRQGRVVNYGDGIYGGMFFTAMYAAAWFETDPRRVVELGRQAIPADSRYGLLIDDLLACHRDHPSDWQAAWRAIEGRWNHDLCPWGPTEPGGKFNIQASFNGAYVALGVLYSGGDYYRAIEITTRAGQDTDSNTANTGGIMGTLVGYEGLPERVQRQMWPYLNRIYHHTDYSIVTATAECVRLAIANVVANGGQERESDVLVRRQPFRHDAPAEVSFPGPGAGRYVRRHRCAAGVARALDQARRRRAADAQRYAGRRAGGEVARQRDLRAGRHPLHLRRAGGVDRRRAGAGARPVPPQAVGQRLPVHGGVGHRSGRRRAPPGGARQRAQQSGQRGRGDYARACGLLRRAGRGVAGLSR